MAEWTKWDIRFMEMAGVVATWASCFQANRQVGCVVVKNKRIMTTGYNGAPAGVKTCKERGTCIRRDMGIPSGQRQEVCYATHAEQNAIIQAARMGVSIEGSTLYCTHQPCSQCTKMIINAGIVRVLYAQGYPDAFSMALFEEAGIDVAQFGENP